VIDRAAIIEALRVRVKAKCPSFVTVDTLVKTWDDVPASEQPCCLIALGSQSPTYSGSIGSPPTWSISATIYIYCRRAPQRSVLEIGRLLNELEGALEWQPSDMTGKGYPSGMGMTFQTTLGGLVQYARIAGEVMTDEGSLGDQQVAVVNVEMRASA
jgi:hypothetical protein